MGEFLKKEDGLTSWRFKLNRILGQIVEVFKGGEGKSILTNTDGKLSWEPLPEKEEQQAITHVDSLDVEGILTSATSVVNGRGIFNCSVEISGQTFGSTLTVSESIILQGSGQTERIYANEKGLVLGSATISNKVAGLPPMLLLGTNAVVGATEESISIYGKACPLKLDIENGNAEFPYGLQAPIISFEGGSITMQEYTGNAASCTKLQKAVKVFGNEFDGSKDISGKIDGCTGITLAKGSKLTFIHGVGELGAGWLECIGDVLHWSGMFGSKSVHVEEAEHYAEWMPCSETMENGDVISLDYTALDGTYCKANASKKHPLGVVTTDYAMSIGKRDSKSYPVCSRGRVKAKVAGKVSCGDTLTLGSIDGTLRAMTSKDKPYEAWAIALESSDLEGVRLIKVHIL